MLVFSISAFIFACHLCSVHTQGAQAQRPAFISLILWHSTLAGGLSCDLILLYTRIKAFPKYVSSWNTTKNGGIKWCVTKEVLRAAGVEEEITSVELVREGEDLKLPRSDGCGNGPNPHYPLNSFSHYAQLLINYGRTKQHFKVGFSFRMSQYIV